MLPKFSLLSARLEQTYAPDSTRQASYAAFCAAYGYTLEDWDSTLYWYSIHELDLLHDMYRQATDTLAGLERQLQARQDSVTTRQEHMRLRREGQLEGVNLLTEGERVYCSGQLINRTFVLHPSVPYTAGRALTLSARLYGLDAEMQAPELELCLYGEDSTVMRRSIPFRPRGEETVVSLIIPESKRVVSVSGSLRGQIPAEPEGRAILCDSIKLVTTMGAGVVPPGASVEPADISDPVPIEETQIAPAEEL